MYDRGTAKGTLSIIYLHLPIAEEYRFRLYIDICPERVNASISVVSVYFLRISDAAVVSVFVSAETETSSNSVITEVCVLIVDVA
jgi:hypothetical protein